MQKINGHLRCDFESIALYKRCSSGVSLWSLEVVLIVIVFIIQWILTYLMMR